MQDNMPVFIAFHLPALWRKSLVMYKRRATVAFPINFHAFSTNFQVSDDFVPFNTWGGNVLLS